MPEFPFSLHPASVNAYVAGIIERHPPPTHASWCVWFYVETYCELHSGVTYEETRDDLRHLRADYLALPDHEIGWFFVRAIVNAVAEKRAEGAVLLLLLKSEKLDSLLLEIKKLQEDVVMGSMEEVLRGESLVMQMKRSQAAKLSELLMLTAFAVEKMQLGHYAHVGAGCALVQEYFVPRSGPTKMLKEIYDESAKR